MRLSDLKLLVDLIWENRNGQVEMLVPPGFLIAARRFQRAGFVAFIGTHRIGLTRKGIEWGDKAQE